MRKKLFTLLLSGALILGSAGSAMAAEKTDCSLAGLSSGKLQAAIQEYLAKYFDGAWNPRPEVPDSGESEDGENKPDSEVRPDNSQKPSQNGGTKAEQVVSMVNQERREAGLETVKSDGELNRLAQLKAEDMAEKGYFSHTSPVYGSAFDMMKAAGYSYRTAGENIAKGQKTASAVMNGWMNSSGHRANILGSSYTKIGVGYAENSSGTPHWVQIFAG